MLKPYFIHCTFTINTISKFGWFIDNFDIESENVKDKIIEKISKQLDVSIRKIQNLDVQAFTPV